MTKKKKRIKSHWRQGYTKEDGTKIKGTVVRSHMREYDIKNGKNKEIIEKSKEIIQTNKEKNEQIKYIKDNMREDVLKYYLLDLTIKKYMNNEIGLPELQIKLKNIEENPYTYCKNLSTIERYILMDDYDVIKEDYDPIELEDLENIIQKNFLRDEW